MERNGKPRKRNEVIAPPVLQEDKFMQLEEGSEECLLPGIGNEVTLELIATKLPWRTLHSLSSVGPAWRQEMQNRLVYDARVRAHSGESFVILNDTQFKFCRLKAIAISLYSLTNNTCYQLPPIPQVESGVPYDCDCIALDGTVYVLGGLKDRTHKFQQLGSEGRICAGHGRTKAVEAVYVQECKKQELTLGAGPKKGKSMCLGVLLERDGFLDQRYIFASKISLYFQNETAYIPGSPRRGTKPIESWTRGRLAKTKDQRCMILAWMHGPQEQPWEVCLQRINPT